MRYGTATKIAEYEIFRFARHHSVGASFHRADASRL